ncbi:AAA family ATPase [Microcoleus sp. herbarium7]|uniref:P-loop NTPase fold protein n=1 Tax=Microcoleus sp. herbarium7 TaxID=3055435 RepID=UPI002FD22731
MTNSSFSSLEDLNAALLSQNPFAKPPFLNASDVWGNEFFDIETINAHASDAVFHALAQIRAGQYPTTSIAITAQDGTGKTHIISRIRHRLQEHGGGLFVYANKYGNINQIKQGFQQILAESLGKIGRDGARQWQELATAMANNALQIAQSDARIFSTQEFVKKFNDGTPRQVKRWVKELTRAFLQAKNVNEPDIVKAILWTLSEEQSLYAIKWLKGEEIAQYKANELELPAQCQSFEAVLQVLDLISQYNELVICFDELDTPDAYDDMSGLHLSQILAGLIKDLFQNLNRGLILSVMMPAQWIKIKQLPGGVSAKVSAHGNPLDLKYMDAESTVNLVSFWLDKYYQLQNLIPPEPIYPFTQIQLSELGQGRPTVREVLKWCREHCKPPILNSSENNQDADISDPVELAFIKELEEEVGNSLEDNYLLADAILFGFQSLIGQTVERVIVQSATDKVTQRGRRDDYINFKVIVKDNGTDVTIGVAVLQYAGGRGLGAGLRRLNDYAAFNLTRGCLVRSKSRRITSYLEQQYLVPLIKQQGGEYVELKEDEIKPLLAIRAVHQKREVDYGVSEEQIFNFITEKGADKMLGTSNPLLKEILSDPSYQVPTDMIEDEPVTVAESIMDDLSDSAQLDEACDNLMREFN